MLQIYCTKSIINKSFYIVSDSNKNYYVPNCFYENYIQLVNDRITKLVTMLQNEYKMMKLKNEALEDILRCNICYQNKPISNLYDFFIDIMNDRDTGNLYESFSQEIKSIIISYLDSNKSPFDKDKPTSCYTVKEICSCLLNFQDNELNILHLQIHEKNLLYKTDLKKIIDNLSLPSNEKNTNQLFKHIQYKYEPIIVEDVKKSYIRFVFHQMDQKTEFQLKSDVSNAIASLDATNTINFNLFVDFHAEEFIYEYLSKTFMKKKLPDLEECKKFLFEINKNFNYIIETTNFDISKGKFIGSKVNIYFIRNNSKLAFKHLNYAMSYFSEINRNFLCDICENLNLIENMLPKLICLNLKTLSNSIELFEIEVFIIIGQKFTSNIFEKICIRYDDNRNDFDVTEDFTFDFDVR